MEHSNIYEVYNAIIKLIDEAEWHKFVVKICETECRSTSLSINLETNNKLINKTVCGTKTYKYKCGLYYQLACQTNIDKLRALDCLSKLGNWLCGEEIEENDVEYQLTGYPKYINKIEYISGPMLLMKNNNGLDVFSLNLEVSS